jgi:hypothetical protein
MKKAAVIKWVIASFCLLSFLLAALFYNHFKVAYYKRKITNDEDGAFIYAVKLAQCGQAGVNELIEWTKEGSYDHDIEDLMALILLGSKADPYDKLVSVANDPEPRRRGYACAVMARLGDERYLPILNKLKDDNAELPKAWVPRTVSERASSAINKINFYHNNPSELAKAKEEACSFVKGVSEMKEIPKQLRGK